MESDREPAESKSASRGRRLRRIAASAASAASAAMLVAGGCAGATGSRRYDGANVAPDEGAPLSGTAAVVAPRHPNPPALEERAADVLVESGLFERVYASTDAPSDVRVVFEVEREGNPANPIPLVTILTLGVLPTYGTDSTGLRFRVVRPESLGGTCFSVRRRRQSGLGWVFLFTAVHPGWDWMIDRDDTYLGEELRRLVDAADARGLLGSVR